MDTGDLRSSYLTGLRDGAPFVLVIVPFATVFGVLSKSAGLNVLEALAFSVAVIAGAAQFTALQLMQVIEGVRDEELILSIIHKLQTHSLAEVAAETRVRSVFEEHYETHLHSIDITRMGSAGALFPVVKLTLKVPSMLTRKPRSAQPHFSLSFGSVTGGAGDIERFGRFQASRFG